ADSRTFDPPRITRSMAGEISDPGPANEPGFFESLGNVLSDFAALLQTRLELATTEFEEEAERLKQTLLLGAISLFFLAIGVILLTLFIVVLFWDTHRLAALGAVTVFYIVIGIVVGLAAKNKMARMPKFLSATLAEFDRIARGCRSHEQTRAVGAQTRDADHPLRRSARASRRELRAARELAQVGEPREGISAADQGAPGRTDRTGGDDYRWSGKIPSDRQSAIAGLVYFPRRSYEPASLSARPARRPPPALLFSGPAAQQPSPP